jgi:nucleotide-binding universal stress UspA family protein
MQSIVVGTDGSPSAQAAVRRGVEVARGSGALVHLVTAFPDVPSYRERIGSSAKRDPIDLREVAEGILARAANEVNAQDVEVQTHAREGDAAQVILDVAEEQNADLIVVGAPGPHRPRALPAGERLEQAVASRRPQRDDRARRVS